MCVWPLYCQTLSSPDIIELISVPWICPQQCSGTRLHSFVLEETYMGQACCMQFLAWDQEARNHVKQLPPSYIGNHLEGVEFNHTRTAQLIFQEDGIAVYSNPAFHYDTPGPVSLSLNWRGLKVTYSGADFSGSFKHGMCDHPIAWHIAGYRRICHCFVPERLSDACFEEF